MQTSLKTCFKCRQVKPIAEFYRHKEMSDGLLGKCKDCTKRDTKSNRLAKIDYYRKYDRLRASQPHRRKQNKLITERWKILNPKRRAAQVAVGNAIKNGRLKKLPCLICGDKAEAHHPNYDAPLDVVWLCPPHHKQAHALVD